MYAVDRTFIIFMALDFLIAVAFAFVLPIVVTLVMGLPLSWNSPFTIYHLLAMCAGVGVYVWAGQRGYFPLFRGVPPIHPDNIDVMAMRKDGVLELIVVTRSWLDGSPH